MPRSNQISGIKAISLELQKCPGFGEGALESQVIQAVTKLLRVLRVLGEGRGVTRYLEVQGESSESSPVPDPGRVLGFTSKPGVQPMSPTTT